MKCPVCGNTTDFDIEIMHKTDYIPISKIEAKIKELYTQRTDKPDIDFPDYDSPNYAIDDKIELLKDLLLLSSSKEEEKEKPEKRLDNNKNTTTQVISFETENDRSKGFSLLMASGLSFNGLGKNKFVVTLEQSLLLQTNKINYKRLDDDPSQQISSRSSSQGDTRA